MWRSPRAQRTDTRRDSGTPGGRKGRQETGQAAEKHPQFPVRRQKQGTDSLRISSTCPARARGVGGVQQGVHVPLPAPDQPGVPIRFNERRSGQLGRPFPLRRPLRRFVAAQQAPVLGQLFSGSAAIGVRTDGHRGLSRDFAGHGQRFAGVVGHSPGHLRAGRYGLRLSPEPDDRRSDRRSDQRAQAPRRRISPRRIFHADRQGQIPSPRRAFSGPGGSGGRSAVLPGSRQVLRHRGRHGQLPAARRGGQEALLPQGDHRGIQVRTRNGQGGVGHRQARQRASPPIGSR